MKKNTVVKLGIVVTMLLLFFLSSACASDNTLKVSFDGNECVLSGPSDLETGAHLIEVQNTSEYQGWMRICRGDDGYIWQDVLDHDFRDDSDVDDDIEWPTWCQGFPSSSVASVESNNVVYEYKLRQEGLYFIIWDQNEPEAAWPCALLTVRKAVVE